MVRGHTVLHQTGCIASQAGLCDAITSSFKVKWDATEVSAVCDAFVATNQWAGLEGTFVADEM